MTLRKRQNLRLQSKLSYCLVRKISSKGLNAKNCRFPSSWYLQHRQRERVHYNWSKSWRWQPHPCVRIGSAEIFYHNDCFLSKRNYGSPLALLLAPFWIRWWTTISPVMGTSLLVMLVVSSGILACSMYTTIGLLLDIINALPRLKWLLLFQVSLSPWFVFDVQA